MKIQPTDIRHQVYSTYQVQGAYAHLNQTENQKVQEAIKVASNVIYFDDPLRLSVPYEYVAKRLPKPPDNNFLKCLACMTIVAIYLCYFVRICMEIFYKKLRVLISTSSSADQSKTNNGKPKKCPKACPSFTVCPSFSPEDVLVVDRHGIVHTQASPRVACTTDTEDEPSYLFESDGITFVIDKLANCIICNDKNQFVGPLKSQECHFQTATSPGSSQYVGMIRIIMMDDEGKSFEYDIPGAVYDPDSPFNILGIPFLGKFFGKDNDIPLMDDDGTRDLILFGIMESMNVILLTVQDSYQN